MSPLPSAFPSVLFWFVADQSLLAGFVKGFPGIAAIDRECDAFFNRSF
jgi:hypothetical protein